MTSMASQAMQRPGGRSARVRRAVLRAAGDVLAEGGLDRLDLGHVAERAGVGKTTLYRRWGSRSALVADLLSDMAETSSPRRRSGSLLEDLEANADLVQTTLDDPRQGPLFAALIAAATCDEDTAVSLERFYDVRVKEWAPCVLEAVERGELAAGTDAEAVIRAVSAPLYYHRLTRTGPIGPARARQAARAAAAAASAEVFVGAVEARTQFRPHCSSPGSPLGSRMQLSRVARLDRQGGMNHDRAVSTAIPADLAPLLDSTAVAFVSTVGPKGEPQTTPMWFMWKHGSVHFSLVDGRQKLRNIQREPRVSVVIVDPAEPTRYLELRGRVDLALDPQLTLEREVAIKYHGSHLDHEPGTMRFAATLTVDHVTSQSGYRVS